MNPLDPIAQAAFICSVGEKARNHFWGHISRKIGAGMQDRAADRLSPAQLQLLEIVCSKGPITMNGLAKCLAVSPPSTSARVDRLVTFGWLRRERSTRDRRQVLVSVPPAARRNIEAFQEIVRREILDLIVTLGPETTQKWCDVLAEIQRAGR